MPRTSVKPHPLAEYAQRVDAERVYTSRQLAELMELAPSSVSSMASYGWFPGGRLTPHRRGGRVYTWTGKQLLRLAARPIKVEYDHERYAPSTLYRVGCRCPVCVRAHSADSRDRNHALAEKAFPRQARERLLALVADAVPVAEAAAKVGVSLGYVYGRAIWDAEYGEALDEAAWSLCVLGESDPACSTASGYRGSPKGKSLRPACRGTGCREWRREQSRLERTQATAVAA